MLKYKIANILLVLSMPLFLFAQEDNSKPLKIGDRLPEITLENVINYKSNKIKLSDFRGKLLIIDYWAKWCTACIDAFPEMQKLQDEFGDKIQILLVTNDSQLETKKLFSTSKNVRELRLPIVFEAKQLDSLLPHRTVPFHTWIDRNGRVVAKTDGYNTTSKLVQDFLNGIPLNLKERDDQLDFDATTSLLYQGNGKFQKHIKYYSFISDYIEGLKGGGVITDTITKKTIGYKSYNNSILSLYQEAYLNDEFQVDNYLLEVKDKIKYEWPLSTEGLDDWKKENLYCYEILLPNANINQMKIMMREDLDKFFNIKSSREKKKVQCYVITGKIKDNFSTKGGIPSAEKTNTGYSLRNVSLGWLLRKIPIANRGKYFIVDETGEYSSVKVDMDFHSKLTDIPSLKIELSKYGLDINEGQRELDMLILKEL